VGGTRKKYALYRPTLPSKWPLQGGTYLIQIEVVALEEAGYFALGEAKMSPHQLGWKQHLYTHELPFCMRPLESLWRWSF